MLLNEQVNKISPTCDYIGNKSFPSRNNKRDKQIFKYFTDTCKYSILFIRDEINLLLKHI